MTTESVYDRLKAHGINPSKQRMAIMEYLMTHPTHPTVEEVYKALVPFIKTLSRTTVYNTLRLFSEHNAAQMITIDEHRVCYDGNLDPHVHFFCKKCEKVYDFMEEQVPALRYEGVPEGFQVHEAQTLLSRPLQALCREAPQNRSCVVPVPKQGPNT